MMSLDLNNPLEQSKFLMPDYWMLFRDFNAQK